MVLESILNPAAAKRRPWETFFLGMLYAVVGVFLAYGVFPEQSSLVMVFLITLASVPLLYFTVKSEEEIDEQTTGQNYLLKEHSKVLLFLMLLFFGITSVLVVLYTFLPIEMTSKIFSTQIDTISNINNNISGAATQPGIFVRIFLNNIRVLIFSILFSFIYGVGAIFILTWNASVIAAAVGNFIRESIAKTVEAVGFAQFGSYFHAFSFGFLRYIIHGIPEVLAYFIGGLAGGIISMSVINHDLFNRNKERVIFDAAELIVIAIGVLVIAGLIEVYVTPVLF